MKDKIKKAAAPNLPKGYKNTEIGVIPEDWEVVKIGNITEVFAGGTPSTLVEEYWNGDIKWMNSGELNLKYIYDVQNRITEEGLKNSSTRLIPEKCVLIGLAGQGKTRGTAAINFVNLCTNQSIAAILPSKKHIPIYLYNYIDSQYVELRKLSTGDGGRGGLNLTIIKNVLIPLPPLPEQKAIATVLSDTDKLIQALEKKIAKKQLIKKGAMQQLLTPKEGWEVKTLGEVAYFSNGKAHEQFIENDAQYIVINSKFVSTQGGVFKTSSVNLSPLKKGDVAMVMSDIPNGKALAKCFLVPEDNKYALNQRICSLRAESVDNVFLSLILNRNKYYLGFDSGTGQTNLKRNDVLNCPIPLPPTLEEQTRIAQILSDMDSEIEALEKKLAKYKQIKQGLMQVLLTGKIRLV